MRHGRFITTALVATAAMAIGPAWAAAAPAPFVDDTAAQFGAGPATDAWAIEPGSVRLRPSGTNAESDNFDGPLDPAKWKTTPWDTNAPGEATVSGGSLTVDGRHVDDPPLTPAATMVPTAGSPLVLEFQATFGDEIFQNIGLGDTFAAGPWAMFSSGDATGSRPLGLYARTLDSGGISTDTLISATTPVGPHVYRIEWSTTDVKFFVDGTQIVTNPTSPPVITTGMRPVVSDVTPGGTPAKTLKVDWLGMGSFAPSGTFTSQVHDAGDARAVWGTLTPTGTTPPGTSMTIQTRSGNTATPDSSWSGFQNLVSGQIQSPIARYIQYQATLKPTNDLHGTPSLDKVEISYDIDSTPPSAVITAADVSGTSASVSFSSPDGDIAGFQCSLDGGAFAACASPKAFTGLPAGAHTVVVRPIDKAGNVGPTVSRTFSIASSRSGGGSAGGGSGQSSNVDKTAPKVILVAKSLKASKKGTVSFTVACPATEATCKVTLKLKNGAKTVASKTVTVKGGKTKTVTLQLNKATRQQLKHRSLKLSSVLSASDAAGNKRTTSKKVTLHKS
jgi:hypothetical protein